MSTSTAVSKVRLREVCAGIGHRRADAAACGALRTRLVGFADLVDFVHVVCRDCMSGSVDQVAVELRNDRTVDNLAIQPAHADSNQQELKSSSLLLAMEWSRPANVQTEDIYLRLTIHQRNPRTTDRRSMPQHHQSKHHTQLSPNATGLLSPRSAKRCPWRRECSRCCARVYLVYPMRCRSGATRRPHTLVHGWRRGPGELQTRYRNSGKCSDQGR